MSQAADLADATETPSSVGDPNADWGATAADWRSLTFKDLGSTAVLKTDWAQDLDWNHLRLEFANVASPQKAPGNDTTYIGLINFNTKRVRFPASLEAPAQFFVDARQKVDDQKRACVYMAGDSCESQSNPTGPTAWVAEEWGPPGSEE